VDLILCELERPNPAVPQPHFAGAERRADAA